MRTLQGRAQCVQRGTLPHQPRRTQAARNCAYHEGGQARSAGIQEDCVIDRKGIGGCKPNPRRKAYMQQFSIVGRWGTRLLDFTLLDILDKCADDEARRILVGRTQKFTAEEAHLAGKRGRGDGAVAEVGNV